MANRLKEDEKNEKIIRGLLKLPANKKCINCNSLGPQYVCTNFSTFICTNCSGIHREFTHRVKSVSMAKFTSQEVIALQEGGNERAKEIFFKEWDQQRHSFPDSSNVERLRTFIKHVYMDRRYTGEKNIDKPPRVKGDREDSYEQRRPETFRGGSQSPSYDEAYDSRYSERPGSGGRNDERNSRYSFEERRSPGYEGDYRRSPGHFEVVDDRRRDERFGRGNQNTRGDDRKSSDGISKMEVRSPNNQRDADISSLPVVRPVRDILGEDAPPLRIGEPSKSNGGRVIEGPTQAPRTASSSSKGSNDGKPVESNIVETGSLIDFSADPEPPVAAAPAPSVPKQTTGPPVDGGNWASFDFVTEQKTPPPTNTSVLESALAELSAPVNAPSVNNAQTFSTVATDSFSKTIGGQIGGQWPMAQQNDPSLFPNAVSQMTVPQSTVSHPLSFLPPVGVPSNQSLSFSTAPNVPGHLAGSIGQTYQTSTVQNIETGAGGVPSQPQLTEAKPTGRKELPANLFTATYPMGPAALPGWQARPHYGMGYGMQYPTIFMQQQQQQVAPSFSYPLKSANPFDVANEPSMVHAPTLPSLTSLHGTLPNINDPSGLLRSSSLGATPSAQWMPHQQPQNPLTVIPGGHVAPQVQSNMTQQTSGNLFTIGNQGMGDAADQRVTFGAPGTDQQMNAGYTQPGMPNSFPPAGGNPFG